MKGKGKQVWRFFRSRTKEKEKEREQERACVRCFLFGSGWMARKRDGELEWMRQHGSPKAGMNGKKILRWEWRLPRKGHRPQQDQGQGQGQGDGKGEANYVKPSHTSHARSRQLQHLPYRMPPVSLRRILLWDSHQLRWKKVRSNIRSLAWLFRLCMSWTGARSC